LLCIFLINKNPIIMKKLLPIFALFASCNLFGQAGPLAPATVTTVAIPGSSATWANTNNVSVSDDVYSGTGDIAGGAGSYTDYLVATNFGFSIPGGSTITGIEVIVERSDASGLTSDYRVRIVKGGVIGSTEMSAGAAYGTADSYGLYGTPFDSWGETWTDADINAADFGIAVAAQRNAVGGSSAAVIDQILITVYYSAVLPVKLVDFSASKKSNYIKLQWTTEEESNISHYEMQRSTNGTVFSAIGNVTSRNQDIRAFYSYDDYNPVNGLTYYRLKSVELNGKSGYSKIVSIDFSKMGGISIYPSKFKAGTVLHITNPANENLTAYFYSTSGKLLGKSNTESNMISASFLSNSKGMIFYKIVNANGLQVNSGTLIAD
jgi:hypothetical protein